MIQYVLYGIWMAYVSTEPTGQDRTFGEVFDKVTDDYRPLHEEEEPKRGGNERQVISACVLCRLD